MSDHGGDTATLRSSSVQREERVTETLKKGTRVTGADRTKLASDLKKRYDAGESIRSLAAATGRSYGFVHRILSENGVSLRGRGGATRGKARAKRRGGDDTRASRSRAGGAAPRSGRAGSGCGDCDAAARRAA